MKVRCGVTKSGFKYEIAPERLENFELVEVFSELESNPLLFPKLIGLLLGEDQKKALYDHVRDDSGFVPFKRIEEELIEIINEQAPLKK